MQGELHGPDDGFESTTADLGAVLAEGRAGALDPDAALEVHPAPEQRLERVGPVTERTFTREKRRAVFVPDEAEPWRGGPGTDMATVEAAAAPSTSTDMIELDWPLTVTVSLP